MGNIYWDRLAYNGTENTVYLHDFGFRVMPFFVQFASCFMFQVAKHLSLKMNEVNFYEPFMEEPAILPGRPLSEMDIVEFVNQHRRFGLYFI